MSVKNLIKNTLGVFCIIILFSIQSFSQIFCDLGVRNNFYKNDNLDEYSGLAYHIDREIFIMPVDDPIDHPTINNIHFKGYKMNAVENAFNITILNPGTLTSTDLTSTDFEGLTYLKEDYFVLLEERENKVYFIQYNEPITGNPYFEVLSGHETGIPQASSDSDDGLEGVTYDPHTNLLYLVREHSDVKLFSIPITLPNSSFPGGIDEQQKSSVFLHVDDKPSGLFHLGKIYPSDNDLSNNLVIVMGGKYEQILEYKVELDSDNNLNANSLNLLRKKDISVEPKPEGVVVYNNILYIASEDLDGGLSSYVINPNAAFCNTDCAQGEIEDWNAETCACEPELNAGCTDSDACNFDESAVIDDCSCLYKNTVCDDGNDKTTNDRINGDCNCKGISSCHCQHSN